MSMPAPRETTMRGVRIPLDVLRETYDEVVACGSQRAVAKAHGWHQAKVKHRVESYMRHAGIGGLPPGITSVDHAARASLSHSGQGKASAYHRAAARIAELEAENAALRERVDELEARPWADIHAKLDAILARPAGTIVALDHRRLRDGGTSRRDQMRAARERSA